MSLIIINHPEAFGLVNDVIRIRRPIERLNPAETERRTLLGIITNNVLPLLPDGLVLRRYSLGEVRDAENRLSLLTELYGDNTYVVSLPIPMRYQEQLCEVFGDLSLPYTVNFYEDTKTRFVSSETIEYGTFTAQFVSPSPNPRPFGPALWNLFYDDLLRLPVPPGVRLVGFADDLAVVVTAHNADLLEQAANPTLGRIDRWLGDNGLQVSTAKSEAVVLTKKWAYSNPMFLISGSVIPVKPAIRYLGVQLDTRLTFTQHIRLASAGARRTSAALGRLMPNVSGASGSKRRLLMSVVHSKLLFGAAIWATTAAKTARNRSVLTQTQRTAALRVARCYRTVSDMAALVEP